MTVEITENDRILQALRATVLAELIPYKFTGIYEFSVQRATSATVDGYPTDSTLGLPNLVGIPIGSLSSGGTATPTVGNLFLVEFLNGDITRPVCSFNQALVKDVVLDASQSIAIGPSAQTVVFVGGQSDVARVGDSIQAYMPLGAVSGTINGSTPYTGVLSIITTTGGVISGGNEHVLA